MVPSFFIIKQLFRYFGNQIKTHTSFITYKKLSILDEDKVNSIDADTIIFDEFHRAGAEKWGDGVKTLLNSHTNSLLIGTTATPIRYLDNNRDMIEELFGGVSIEELPITMAIVRGILPNPTYVTAMYSLKDEILSLKRKIKNCSYPLGQKQNLLKKIDDFNLNWERTNGIPSILSRHIKGKGNKFIVFCRDKAHISDMVVQFNKWFKEIGYDSIKNFIVFTNFSSNNSSIRKFEELGTLKKKEVALLFCIDMLNEGLHVPNIDGVFLMRKTASPIVFMQQIGRALTAGSKRQPLIFDLSNNFASIKGNFFYSEMNDVLMDFNRRRTKLNLPEIEFDIHIIDETLAAIDLFKSIENRLSNSWHDNFLELARYKERFGDCLVPVNWHEDVSLGKWVALQRSRRERGFIRQDEIKKLDSIGFVWNTADHAWDRNFKQLVQHMKETGTCCSPMSTPLGVWINNQRANFRLGKLSEDKIKKLNSVGFVWSKDDTWDLYIGQLKEYKQTHGDCLVPKNDEFLHLAYWVSTTRSKYSAGELEQEKIDELNGLGFVWDVFDYLWYKNYGIYKETLIKGEKSFDKTVLRSISTWASRQRQNYKENKLKKEYIDLLYETGFKFNLK